MMLKIIAGLLLILSCAHSSEVPAFNNPIVPGDFPDPSVVREGSEYWATATSSEWAPHFPLLHSRDLVHWKQVGSIFEQSPTWSTENYWAPEITQDKDRYFLLYTARKRKGPLCVGVALAPKPQGPYADKGPLVCQAAGSIDGAIMRDENGVLHLIWKEDGNSRNLPTPIWIQRLAEDGSALLGERKELLRNDAPWERHVVEGGFLWRRGEYFYMFYAGNACCGRECNYAAGVARAKKLLGPWEKNPANPIIKGNDVWKCPGHGTLVDTPDGRTYFMYHAYHARDSIYAGRQGLLDEVTWTAEGWPVVNGGKGPSGTLQYNSPPPMPLKDDFAGKEIDPGWQWPNGMRPLAREANGVLELSPAPNHPKAGGVLARSTLSGNYTASTVLDLTSVNAGGQAGMAVFGDPDNSVGLAYSGKLLLWRRERGKLRVIATAAFRPSADLTRLHLRVTARDGNEFKFAYSTDGSTWHEVGSRTDGSYLPPWDRALRVGMTVSGTKAPARFDSFQISGVQ
jgi:xylan 1,4-beta-xylosidase